MGFTLGCFYARLPAAVRWCFTKLLKLVGILVALLAFGITSADRDSLPWLQRTNFILVAIGVLGFLLGVFGNIVADRFLKWESKRLPPVKDFFQNHHLAQLVGQSLGMLLRTVSAELKNSADAKTAYHLAKNVEAHWTTISVSETAQRHLIALQDRELVSFVRDPKKPALNHRQADALLSLINPDAPGDLPTFQDDISHTTLREQIILRFGEALREALKRDFAQDGKGAMSMLLDISSQLLNNSTARAPRNDDNRAALDEIRNTLKTLSAAPLTKALELQGKFDSLALQLDETYVAVREEGEKSKWRHGVTHQRLRWIIFGVGGLAVLLIGGGWKLWSGQQASDAKLTSIEQLLTNNLSPKQAGEDPTKKQLSPELIEQAKILLERGNREQQALAQIALKHHADADHIIQELKKNPIAEAFRVLTLEGDNWYNAGEFDRAIEPYEQALALRPNDVQVRNSAANALMQTQLGDTVAHLSRAVELYSGSLKLSQPKSEDWAVTQNNLGVALRTQGERTEGEAGTHLLGLAVMAHRAALEVRTRAAQPQDWAATQNNLGLVLQSQGERTEGAVGTRLIVEAVAAYRAALEVYTRATLPQNWAAVQNNLGGALWTQGERTEGAAGAHLLSQALDAYRAASEVYTRAALPHEWSATESNLGVVLRTLGERTEGAAGIQLLGLAVEAYRAALEVRTRGGAIVKCCVWNVD